MALRVRRSTRKACPSRRSPTATAPSLVIGFPKAAGHHRPQRVERRPSPMALWFALNVRYREEYRRGIDVAEGGGEGQRTGSHTHMPDVFISYASQDTAVVNA